MIKIEVKKDCCGCHACFSVCPKHCITMQADREGFLYPSVDKDACVNCGLCETVCPVINQEVSHVPLKVYASRCMDDEVRMHSSSGGIFTFLAKAVIDSGGVVFGAKFNHHWAVVHAWTDNIEGIAAFRGSKYVQSVIGNAYKEAKEFLQEGRIVLFSGTPCQIAGLKAYLRKEYDNLLTVDVICHGVPSPLVWKKYLDEVSNSCQQLSVGKTVVIKDVSFRDKVKGWKDYGIRIDYSVSQSDLYSAREDKQIRQSASENTFMRCFLSRLDLRPSCHACPSKSGKSGSDITIADFWGIEKYNSNFIDDKGTSAVLINTSKGEDFFTKIDVLAEEHPFTQLKSEVTTYYRSVEAHPMRNVFFSRLKVNSLEKLVNEYVPRKKKTPRKSFMKKLSRLLGIKDFRIIWDKPGQTCNRLWAYLDTIAWSVRTKKKTYILFWDKDIKYFNNLRNNPYVKFPLYNSTFIKWLGDATYQNLLTKLFANRFLNRFYSTTSSKKFVSGWKRRASNDFFPYVKEEIHDLYAPNQDIVDEVQQVMSRYKQDGYFIIGVHIRRGDYKTFEGGKYYFELDEYKEQMQALCSVYHDRRVCFAISTNESIDLSVFDGLELCKTYNTTAIHDLYMLSICDRIIGPLSTFSRWASFYGKVPLCFIERKSKIKTDCDFSIIKDFYHFENGVEIENLTDKKSRV